MESSGTPENVLLQVEALFSAIESLPESVRGEALKTIQLKLGINESAEPINATCTSTGTSSLDTPAKDDGSEEKAKPKTAAAAKTKRIATPRAKRTSGSGGSRAKKDTDDINSAPTPKTEKVDVAVVAKPLAKREIRPPRRLVEDSIGLDAEDAANLEVAEEEGDDGAEDESTAAAAATTGKETLRGVLLAADDPHRVHVYKVPRDVNAKDCTLNDSDMECSEIKRKKGQKTLYGCTLCTRKFHSKSLVFIHMRKHTGERPHKCTVCEKSFSQVGGLSMHLKRHQGIFNFNCQYCEYKTLLKVDMVRHEARHRKERNYFCEVCGKSFATDPALRLHIQHVHERHQRFVCQICGFVTHQAGNLKRHIDVRHTNKESLQCPVCDDVIKQRSSFITHMRTHTNERPYQCRQCPKRFKNQSQVAAHARTHSEGQFACGECSRVFKTKFHLKRHSLVHTGEKPFACEYCSYSCNVKGNINKHVKMVHGMVLVDHKAKAAELRRRSSAIRLPVEQDELREKGALMAQTFLSKMSLRKDEQLTVETLQQDLEQQKRQHYDQEEQKRQQHASQARGVKRERPTSAKGRATKRAARRPSTETDSDSETDLESESESEDDDDDLAVDEGVQIEFCADRQQQQEMLEQNLQITLITGMGEQVQRAPEEAECSETVNDQEEDGQGEADGRLTLTLLDDEEDEEAGTVAVGADGDRIFIPNNFICVQEDETGESSLQPMEGTVYVIRCDEPN